MPVSPARQPRRARPQQWPCRRRTGRPLLRAPPPGRRTASGPPRPVRRSRGSRHRRPGAGPRCSRFALQRAHSEIHRCSASERSVASTSPAACTMSAMVAPSALPVAIEVEQPLGLDHLEVVVAQRDRRVGLERGRLAVGRTDAMRGPRGPLVVLVETDLQLTHPPEVPGECSSAAVDLEAVGVLLTDRGTTRLEYAAAHRRRTAARSSTWSSFSTGRRGPSPPREKCEAAPDGLGSFGDEGRGLGQQRARSDRRRTGPGPCRARPGHRSTPLPASSRTNRHVSAPSGWAE